MSEVIVYCSASTKEALGTMRGCAVMANYTPMKPANRADIIIVENDYEADGGKVNALRELYRFRQAGWIGAFILLDKPAEPPKTRLWEAARKDPLVRYLSLVALITRYSNADAVAGLLANREYLAADLDELYEDYREAIYGYHYYLDELRHELRSKLNDLGINAVDEGVNLSRLYWEQTLRYLRREHHRRVEPQFLLKLWKAIEDATDTELMARMVSMVFEKLIQRIAISVDYNPTVAEPVSLLYICNNLVEFERLNKRLEVGIKDAPLELFHAFDADSALKVLTNNSRITGLVSNYRFRDEHDVFRLYNGATILREINEKQGPFNLAYLTRHRRAARRTVPGMHPDDIFDKTLLIDQASGKELHRFLRFAYRSGYGTVNSADRWPGQAGSTADGSLLSEIRRVHDEQYLSAPERRELREKINTEAEAVLTALLGTGQKTDMIPTVSKISGKRDQLSYLCRILKLRCVVMGLCNTSDLEARFSDLRTLNNNPLKERMNIIYGLLSSSPSARPTTKTDKRKMSKKVSEYFSFLGMSIKNDYSYESPGLASFTTQEERDWLRYYRKEQH